MVVVLDVNRILGSISGMVGLVRIGVEWIQVWNCGEDGNTGDCEF